MPLQKKLLLTAALLALTFQNAPAQHNPPIRVGMIYHGAGKFDGGFNQNAYEGVSRAARELPVQVKELEATDPSQIIQGLRAFARENFDLIISLGVASSASVTQAAREYPQLNFGLTETVSPALNVASLVFRHEEGSYLVGYLAALNSSTGVIAFLGGMDIPLTHRYQAGFEAGAKAANPSATVISQYLGTTPDAWNNPGKAREMAASMRGRGADIIFAAAGGSSNGVIDDIKQAPCLKASQLPRGVTFKNDPYAKVPKSTEYRNTCAGNTRPMFFIGVDTNQNPLGDFDRNPATLNHGLTSMRVRSDQALYDLIRDVQQGKFKGGEHQYGLREGGVGYVLDGYNQALIPQAQRVELQTLKARIERGLIRVPRS